MAYIKQNWVNLPDGTTPIYADQLRHIEDGIAAIDSTLGTNQPPSWVLTTLLDTLTALAHPLVVTVTYADGWTLDPTMIGNAKIAWVLIGGSSATPPPATAGPQVWELSDGDGIHAVIDEPINA